MCRIFSVSRSGYYRWRNRPESSRSIENKRLDAHIKAIYKKHKGRYGSPKITDELKDKGFHVSKNRVARRMKEVGLRSIVRRKYRPTTDSKHSHPVADNLRMVVGWTLSSSLSSQMVQMALHRAIQRRQPEAGLIIHSDRGVQYACKDFRRMLDKHNFVQSMSRKGNCWDNAVAESFFSIIKSEMIYHERFKDRDEALPAVFEYIEVYYNRKRKHSTLGYQTPSQVDGAVETAVCF